MVAWYRGVLDQIEQEARDASDGPWWVDGMSVRGRARANQPNVLVIRHTWPQEAAHIIRHDPAAVLRDVEAKRRIIELHEAMRAGVDAAAGTVLAGAARIRLGGYGNVLRLLAGVYADWPGYRQEWSP